MYKQIVKTNQLKPAKYVAPSLSTCRFSTEKAILGLSSLKWTSLPFSGDFCSCSEYRLVLSSLFPSVTSNSASSCFFL